MNSLIEMFQTVLIASRDASILVLAIAGVLLLVANRIPGKWRYLIWLLVAVRLMMPTIPTSSFSWQSWLQQEPSFDSDNRPIESLTRPNVKSVAQVELPSVPVTHSTPSIASKKTFDWMALLTLVWLSGTGIYVALVIYGWFRFQRRLTKKFDTNSDIQQRISNYSQRFSVSVPDLMLVDTIKSPALVGVFRPKILLPEEIIDQLDEGQLDYVIMHELAHLARRDLWVQWVLILIRAVHWFNPLIWWSFRQVQIECERATDEFVLLKSPHSDKNAYSETLLRVLECSLPDSKLTPGMVGISENYRNLKNRIQSIARFKGKYHWWSIMLAICLVIGLTMIGLTQAPEKQPPVAHVEPDASNQPKEKVPKLNLPEISGFQIEALDYRNERPLVNATITLRASEMNNDSEGKWVGNTDADGLYQIDLPNEVQKVWATVEKDGFVEHYAQAKRGQKYQFLVDPRVAYGGHVVDINGTPIVDALVEFDWHFYKAETPEGGRQWSRQYSIKTDKDGAWRAANVSKHLILKSRENDDWTRPSARVRWFRVSHPEYRRVEIKREKIHWAGDFADQSAVVTLHRSPAVTGKVVSVDGSPVDSANVFECLRRFSPNGKKAKTNKEGQFSIHLNEGDHMLHFAKTGYFLELKKINVTKDQDNSLGEIVLEATEPLIIRATYGNGDPASGVSLYLNQVNSPNHRGNYLFSGHPYSLVNLKTNEKGRAIWQSPARPEDWSYSTWHKEFFRVQSHNSFGQLNENPRGVYTTPHTYTIHLDRAISVSGRITDAATGEPISDYFLLGGQKHQDGSTSFINGNTDYFKNTDGSYRFKLAAYDGPFFRVGAKGYITQLSKEYWAKSGKRTLTEDFALQRIDQLPGIEVLLPGGKGPAADSMLVVINRDDANFNNLKLSKDSRDPTIYKTDSNGKMPFPTQPGNWNSWIIHEKGFQGLHSSELNSSLLNRVALEKYSGAKGQLFIDSKPGAKRKLRFISYIRAKEGSRMSDQWTIDVDTDESGNFETNQLLPGTDRCGVFLVDSVTGNQYPRHITSFPVKPDTTHTLKLITYDKVRTRFKGKFVYHNGNPFGGDLKFANITIVHTLESKYKPQKDFTKMGMRLEISDDGTFISRPYLPGTCSLFGSFRFFNGQNVDLKQQDNIKIPDQPNQETIKILDLGDIPIDY